MLQPRMHGRALPWRNFEKLNEQVQCRIGNHLSFDQLVKINRFTPERFQLRVLTVHLDLADQVRRFPLEQDS